LRKQFTSLLKNLKTENSKNLIFSIILPFHKDRRCNQTHKHKKEKNVVSVAVAIEDAANDVVRGSKTKKDGAKQPLAVR
jgi:hypothetical protein